MPFMEVAKAMKLTKLSKFPTDSFQRSREAQKFEKARTETEKHAKTIQRRQTTKDTPEGPHTAQIQDEHANSINSAILINNTPD